MRTIATVLVGAALFAFLAGMPPFDFKQKPIAFLWPFVIMAGMGLYLWLSYKRLLKKREAAYRNGRERRGTAKLRGNIDGETPRANVLFSTNYGEWIMVVRLDSLKGMENRGLAQGLPAKGFFGPDETMYGLDIGEVRTVPLSQGHAFEGKIKEAIEKQERN